MIVPFIIFMNLVYHLKLNGTQQIIIYNKVQQLYLYFIFKIFTNNRKNTKKIKTIKLKKNNESLNI